MNARHVNSSTLISTTYSNVLLIPTPIRSNLDYIFLGYTRDEQVKRQFYQRFACMIKINYSIFSQIFDCCTQRQGGFLVINNNFCRSYNKPEDIIFWYRTNNLGKN